MVRLETVLCPIDFSEFSRHAFDRAVAIAGSHGARVFALHVPPMPSSQTSVAVPLGPEGPGPYVLHHLDREQLLDEMRRFLRTDGTEVPVELAVVESPSPYREILVQAARIAADLVVMGTHGRSGFERLLLGSTTERVLRRATVPVLTVPGRSNGGKPTGGFNRILCAVDFSACSLPTVEYASSLAEEVHGQLVLLHVVELLPVVYEPTTATPFDFERDRPALEELGREHLHRFVPPAIRARCEIEEVVTSGKPYVQILEQARVRQADLIALGVHGHHALDALLFGSTANHVVRRATCPVLTVRGSSERR